MDLRKYRDIIKDAVAKLRAGDKNWGWRIKSLTKDKLLIRWGYLDYIGQKGDFGVKLRVDDLDGDADVSLIGSMDTEYNDLCESLYCWVGDKHWHDARDIGEGLRMVISEIGYQAHSRY